jgi:O-antigen ligase
VAATFFSLSTGAFLAVGTQILLTGYEFITRTVKARWKILITLCVITYIVIDLLSNRSPFEVFVSYMTFDQSTSYNRVRIWNFGTAQIWRTPLFGIGLTGDWIRPWWMSPSMDNFWLVLAVRYGLMAFILFAAGCIFLLRDVGKAQIKDPAVINIRLGWMFAIISIFVAICSVHLWSATFCFFMFVLGAGTWIADYSDEEAKRVDGNEDTVVETNAGKKPGNFRPAIRRNPAIVERHVNSKVSGRSR